MTQLRERDPRRPTSTGRWIVALTAVGGAVAAIGWDRGRPTGAQVAVRLSGPILRLLPVLPRRLALALVSGSRSRQPPRVVRCGSLGAGRRQRGRRPRHGRVAAAARRGPRPRCGDDPHRALGGHGAAEPRIAATERSDPKLGRGWLGWAAALHAGNASLEDPLLSPLHADLTGLSPVHLSVGTRDIFVHDVRLFRQRLTDAGVAVEDIEEPGAVHVYPTFVGAPEARRTIAAQAAFLRAHLR